jgi:RNA polymerase sigma-70 factor (ECF subfamily)
MPMSETDLEALYERLEKPIYNVLYRRVWKREAARDLTQETFVRLWKMRRKVVPDTVEPLAYRIALNLATSRLRRRRILRWVPFDPLSTVVPDPHDTERELSRSREHVRLREAVTALPDDLRDVILLSEFTEMNYDQVGRALGIPAGTVGSRRNRALKRLRADLERE